jgi:prepilin signal peptidase PulO-like enzyme (type II secretory pathway)
VFLYYFLNILLYLPLFLAGLCFGSFLNVLADRFSNNTSPFKGRSKCDACDKTLTGLDLVPLISFFLTKGKCRYCKVQLSWYYPFSELITGLLFIFLAYKAAVFSTPQVSSWLHFIYLAFIFSIFIALLLADLKYMLLPNKLVFSALFVVIFYSVFLSVAALIYQYYLLNSSEFGQLLLEVGYFNNKILQTVQSLGIQLVSTFLIWSFFALIILITKGKGMGGGDAKFSLVLGMFHVFPLNVFAVFLSFFIGTIVCLPLVLFKKAKFGVAVPFGPFLIIASFITYFWGNEVLDFLFVDLRNYVIGLI